MTDVGDVRGRKEAAEQAAAEGDRLLSAAGPDSEWADRPRRGWKRRGGFGAFCWLLLVAALYCLSSSDVAEDDASKEAEAAEPVWHSVKPAQGEGESEYAPGGLLCQMSTYGQLQNQVNSFQALLLLALHLNRTAVMPTEVARSYRWLPLAQYRSRLLVTGKFRCAAATHVQALEKQCNDGGSACDLARPRAAEAARRATAGVAVLGMSGRALFYSRRRWATSTPDFVEFFYANLLPVAALQRAADAYVQKTFGARPFAAVHLRWLEGACPKRARRYPGAATHTAALCSPPRKLTMRIMRGVLEPADLDWPIFVASDRQRLAVLRTYVQAGDATLAMGAEANGTHLNSLHAAVLDFEIAARANFFVGVLMSSASKNIANLRRFRKRPSLPEMDARRHWYPSYINWTLPFAP